MKILYTKHAEKKFKDLAELGGNVNKRLVADILENPLHLDAQTDTPKKIA